MSFIDELRAQTPKTDAGKRGYANAERSYLEIKEQLLKKAQAGQYKVGPNGRSVVCNYIVPYPHYVRKKETYMTVTVPGFLFGRRETKKRLFAAELLADSPHYNEYQNYLSHLRSLCAQDGIQVIPCILNTLTDRVFVTSTSEFNPRNDQSLLQLCMLCEVKY